MNCVICGNAGHRASRCAELRAPLKEGFQGGGGGGGGHSHDEEEECLHTSGFTFAEEERSCAVVALSSIQPLLIVKLAPRMVHYDLLHEVLPIPVHEQSRQRGRYPQPRRL